jgi:ribosomal-protein-alanine N-acetyltransferase
MRTYDQKAILTERLLLRPLREADAPELFAMHSDPNVMHYWSTPTGSRST